MPFPKGACPNPGGLKRKGRAELAALAREYTEDAIKTLADICTDAEAPAAARVTAASALLDRGWGKPTQEVNINDERDYSVMDENELDKSLAVEISMLNGMINRNVTH